jgi:hypothetical protein
MNKRDDDAEYPLLETQKEEGLINSSNGVAEEEGKKEGGEEKTYSEAIIVAMAVFSAYAAMVVLQHKLAGRYFEDTKLTGDELKAAKVSFQHACSFNYIGNMVFRIAHNFVFSGLSPRQRVYVSLISIATAMCIISFVVVIFKHHWLGWIYLSYFLGGMGIGTFGPNFISSITPLGHNTKVWAISGMPVGFNVISIVGFAAQALGAPLISLYLFVCALVGVGSMIYFFRIPNVPIKNNSVNAGEFIANLKQWREWFPKIKFNGLALMVDMYCVSFFSAALLYIYNDGAAGTGLVPLFGAGTLLFSHDWFFAINNSFTFCGDTISRKFAYWAKPRHPLQYIILSITGALLCISKIAILAPIGMFLIFFANGAVYGTSTRFIDNNVDKRYNLIALSVWLFMGDIGSVTGSNTYEPLIEWLCSTHNAHICMPRK